MLNILKNLVYTILAKQLKMKKGQTGGFVDMLLDALGANFLRDMLAGKGLIRTVDGTITAGEGTTRAGQDF